MRQPDLRTTVLLRGEQTGSRLSVVENVVPPRSGPPLHVHDFDEVFYLLDGELVIQVGDHVETARTGDLVFAPRGVPHALVNRTDDDARCLLVCAPAGLERHFARRSAEATGTETPAWALQPGPDVVQVGPPLPTDA